MLVGKMLKGAAFLGGASLLQNAFKKKDDDYNNEENEDDDDDEEEEEYENDKDADEEENSIDGIKNKLNLPLYFIAYAALMTVCFFMIDKSYHIYCILAFVVLGTIGYLIIKRNKRYIRYMQIILIQREYDINKIADIVGKSYQEVVQEISNLIVKGCISNCYIDNSKHRIIYNNKRSSISGITKQKIVKCKSCGADVTIGGLSDGICKYCGQAN